MITIFDLEKLKSGDLEEWGKLNNHVVQRVNCHRLTRGKDAEFGKDKVQEVMEHLVRGIGTVKEPKAFVGFVARTVTNVLIDWYRKAHKDPLKGALDVDSPVSEEMAGPQNPLAEKIPDGVSNVFERVGSREGLAIVLEVIEELGDICKKFFAVIIRYESRDRNLPDTNAVAKEMGITMEAFYQRRHRCQDELLEHPRIKELLNS